jgi:hypothetical protein
VMPWKTCLLPWTVVVVVRLEAAMARRNGARCTAWWCYRPWWAAQRTVDTRKSRRRWRVPRESDAGEEVLMKRPPLGSSPVANVTERSSSARSFCLDVGNTPGGSQLEQ